MPMPLAQLRHHPLAEQGSADEHRLAVDPGHATAVMAEVGDVCFEGNGRDGVGT